LLAGAKHTSRCAFAHYVAIFWNPVAFLNGRPAADLAKNQDVKRILPWHVGRRAQIASAMCAAAVETQTLAQLI